MQFINSNGNVSLIGRAKGVININGVKIVAADMQTAIEDVLGDRVARLLVFPPVALHTEQVTVAYMPKFSWHGMRKWLTLPVW